MSDKSGKISQSANHSSGANLQVIKGNNNRQTNSHALTDSGTDQELTTAEVIVLLNKIQDLLNTANLPDTIKEDAATYLNAAKKATDKEEPKKETAAINLKEMAETLKDATETIEASNSLWEKVQPILVQIANWLGVAATSLLTYLSS